ncbi:hypothetical protein BDA96_07G179900 [Sorghum bicolor]|uniref:Uncharacterized protein n=2 Tax=Sorghum bicolor TaxID=4558 RepID=A0A921QNH9_SORBI|nr:uncharacterized protein LOC110437042 [Sorghum bicolor]KAG0524090.1 hypothetical protein BDA96_07G179900 [Sorghum bicolor]KXG25381.1 hypothetical protein SORBI_3007G168100 [Sorghum bicolor]|eukprot:XP_021320800.1 uncharacterized protein LOC110437042 [Sorghum bicolor]
MPPVVPRSDRIVRRTAMVGAATAAYLLLTADYGPGYPNPIRNALESLSLFPKSDTDKDNVHQAEQDTSNLKPDGTVIKSSSASPTGN